MNNSMYPEIVNEIANNQQERMMAESANILLVASLKEKRRARFRRMARPLAIAAVLIILLGMAFSIALAGAG